MIGESDTCPGQGADIVTDTERKDVRASTDAYEPYVRRWRLPVSRAPVVKDDRPDPVVSELLFDFPDQMLTVRPICSALVQGESDLRSSGHSLAT